MHECAYQCVRPVLVYPLVWILPFMATAQLLWLLWMMLHPPMASYVIYASILPWIHRNEAWIDEISLWALGAWIFISNQYRRLFNGYDLPRRNEGDSQEALEVDVSLCIQPDERKDQLTPVDIITPRKVSTTAPSASRPAAFRVSSTQQRSAESSSPPSPKLSSQKRYAHETLQNLPSLSRPRSTRSSPVTLLSKERRSHSPTPAPSSHEVKNKLSTSSFKPLPSEPRSSGNSLPTSDADATKHKALRSSRAQPAQSSRRSESAYRTRASTKPSRIPSLIKQPKRTSPDSLAAQDRAPKRRKAPSQQNKTQQTPVTSKSTHARPPDTSPGIRTRSQRARAQASKSRS